MSTNGQSLEPIRFVGRAPLRRRGVHARAGGDQVGGAGVPRGTRIEKKPEKVT